MKTVSSDTLHMPVEGVNLAEATLGDQIQQPTLLVFLRHFGCIFCREMVRDLRKAKETIEHFPNVIFVYQGSVQDGQVFFDRFWPGVAAIADTSKKLYQAFGIGSGSVNKLFGPMVWSCAIRAGIKGNGVGKPVGDVWTMPGMFLIQPSGVITWQHQFAHIGDHPDLKSIPTIQNHMLKPEATAIPA